MNARITHDQFDDLKDAILELETLTSKKDYGTKQDEARNAYLLARISVLKSGVSGDQFRRFQMQRLLDEVNTGRSYPIELPALATDLDGEYRSRIRECRANAAGTQDITYTEPTQGGTLTPANVSARCYATMQGYDDIFDPQFSNVVETQTGTVLPIPIFDDVETDAALVQESADQSGSGAEDQSIASVGQVQLNTYTFRSGMVVLSRELEQDGGYPWGQLLELVFARRLARGIGSYLINGTGSGQPTGLITAVLASGSSPIIAAGSAANDGGDETGATSVGTGDFVAMFKALNKAYRAGAAWYMSDDVFCYLLGLLDKYGRPIVYFVQGMPMILGKPVAICPSMPSLGASQNTVLFGNPFYFIQRRAVGATQIRRYTQKYGLAENYQAGYEQWMRVDSNLLVPSASQAYPFVLLQNHS